MTAYHEVTPDAVASILSEGLKRTSRGEKGDDSAIARTDRFLDDRRPDTLKDAAVSRDDNLYGFVTDARQVARITDGQTVAIDTFIQQSEQAVLELDIDPNRSYVSDLDLFDSVKSAIESGNTSAAERLAEQYWHELAPLQTYKFGSIKRPEIMVTYDVDPAQITVVKDS